MMFDRAMTLSPSFWMLAVIATLFVGMAKAGFGGAATNLGVPLIALVVPPPLAAAILLPVLLAQDAIGVVVYRHRFDRHQIVRVLPGACIGIIAGYLLFERVDACWIRVIIGIEATWFAVGLLSPSLSHGTTNLNEINYLRVSKRRYGTTSAQAERLNWD